jgi:hypothetical protein
MDYHVEDLEDQIIATLKANTDLGGMKQIDTHTGEVSERTFLDPAFSDEFQKKLPCILIQYQGRVERDRNEDALVYRHELTFRLFHGASAVRSKREARVLGIYPMLRATFDSLHGAWPLYSGSTLFSAAKILSGVTITTPNFVVLSPLMEAGGQDERLVVNIPGIIVYQTDYTMALQTQ